MSKPYPGYPPSYNSVQQTGGFARTCVVIEFLTLGQLSSSELAIIQEQLEATVSKLRSNLVNVERTDVVLPDRFDPVLREGLRLNK